MLLCAACGRHVRESTCPFCGAIVSTALTRARTRGSRTARILGVAAIGVACGGTTSPGDGGSKDATEDFTAQPPYGAVIPDAGNDSTVNDASSSDASDASDEGDADETGIALYGAPPPPDQ